MAEELGGLTATIHTEVDQSDIKKNQQQIASIFDNGQVSQGVKNLESLVGKLIGETVKGNKSLDETNKILADGLKTAQKGVEKVADTVEETTKKTKKHVKDTAKLTKEEIDGIDNALKKVAGYVAGYFAIDTLRGFAQQVQAIRQEFSSTEKSFAVLLKSDEKGSKLFEDIKQFAIDTPMGLQELASSAKMMLGFGIPLSQVMENLKMLGDVAMGDKNRFMSLSLAFSQASAAGKLMGQDLLQMINAGFNPLSIMVEKTGKSMTELKKEMSNGQISAEKMRQAFLDATQEGGKFNGMLEKQANTMGGAKAKLEDAIDNIYNEIGKIIEDKAISFYRFLETVVDNYQKIAKTLAELTAAYGIYRVALIAVNSLQKASAIATRMNTIAIAQQGDTVKKVTALQVMFGKAQKSAALGLKNLAGMINPYTLIAVGVAGLTYGIYKLVTAESSYERVHRELTESQATLEGDIRKEKREIDLLFSTLKNAEAGTKKWQQARDTIVDKYGAYLQGLDKEKSLLEDIEGSYKAITTAVRENYKEKMWNKTYEDIGTAMGNAETYYKKQMYELAERYEDTDKVVKAKENIDNFVDKVYNEIGEIALIQDKDEQHNKLKHLWETAESSWARRIKLDNAGFFEGANAQYYEQNLVKELFAQKVKEIKALELFGRKSGELLKTDSDEEQTPKPTQQPDVKAAKERVESLRKYAKEYIEIKQWENDKLKALETDFNKTEKEKADERAKIETDVKDKMSSLVAKSIKVTEDDRKKIADYYTEYAQMTVEKAREVLPKAQRRITELETDVKGSRGASANKNAELKFDIKTAAGEMSELTVQSEVAEYLIKKSKESVDFSGLTAKYAEFVQSYIDITENGKVKLAEINKQLDNKGLTEQEKNRLQNELEWETNETQMKVQRLIQKFDGKEYDNLKMIITEVFRTTGNQMQTVINAQIVSLEKQISEFGKVDTKERAEELAELKTRLAATQAALERLKREMQSGNKKTTFWKDFSNNLSDIQSKTDDLFNQISKIDEVVGGGAAETIKDLQSVFNTTYNLIGGIKDFQDVCAKGIIETGNAVKTAMNMIETASAILAIISAVISMIKLLKSIIDEENPMTKFIDNMKLANLELKEFRRELEQIQGLGQYQTIFGDDVWGQIGEKINYANQALQRLGEVGKKNNIGLMLFGTETPYWGGNYLWTDTPYYKKLENQIDSLKDWKAIMSKTVKNMTFEVGTKGKWFWKKHIMDSIGNAAPALFDENGEIDMDMLGKFVDQQSEAYQKLTEEQKAFLKESVDDWKEYQEYLQQVKDSFSGWFGGLTNEIADMWVNAFKAGRYELEDFKDIWNNTIEQMTTSIMVSKFITPIFNNIEKQLGGDDFYTAFSQDPEGKLDDMMSVFDEGFRQLNQAYEGGKLFMQELHDKYGLYQTDVEKGSRNTLSGGGIQSITQDTAEELNGRITQIQSHTYNIVAINTEMRDLSQQQLLILQGIKTDTQRLEKIESEITTVRAVVTDIKDRGIKLL